MTVSVVKVRRLRYGWAWVKGVNDRGHEVETMLSWSRVAGIADDLAHGEVVRIELHARDLISVKNPRMRRTA